VTTSLASSRTRVPQESGDFLVLLHSGFSRRQALVSKHVIQSWLGRR